MKKLLSLTLALAIIICAIPLGTFTFTASAAISGYYTYSVSNGEAAITDVDPSISGNVFVPVHLGGYPVTDIGENAFEDCDNITSITIPETVTTIGFYAFAYCNKLTTVNYNAINCTWSGYSSSLVYDYPVFKGSPITTVNIGSKVEKIFYGLFKDCTSLVNITIPDSVTYIGGSAFYNCSSLKNINIPDGVKAVYASTFYDCISLTNITIPDSVTSIGERAFSGCTSLKSVTMSENVTDIGENAFEDCDNITSITIPETVTTIGFYAFSYCNKLTTVNYNAINCTWSGYSSSLVYDYPIFKGSPITTVNIGSKVEKIFYCLFKDCTNITDVYYDGSWAEFNDIIIGNYNSSITSATIHYTNEDLLKYNFNNTDSTATIAECAPFATEVVIPQSIISDGKAYTVTGISNYAFSTCGELKSITIPNTVTKIGDYAFYGCGNLTTVFYTGSKTEKENISFGSNNECLLNATWNFENCIGGAGHAYDNACDDTCNLCNTVREAPHNYNNDCDGQCNLCGATRTPKHYYDDGCDGRCDVCGTTRVPNHIYDNGCDTDCNLCGGNRQVPGHIYDNACDSTCNECDYVRQVPSHVYDNSSDIFCNVCNKPNDKLTYTVSNNEVTITSLSTEFSGELNIPDTIEGYPVTEIASYAFENCDKLTHLSLPNSITYMGSSILSGCTGLLELEIPYIDTWFGNLFGSVSYGEIANENVPLSLKQVTINNGTISNSAFEDCDSISVIILGDGVTSIGSKAFYNCNSITTVTIGNSVETIGASAFEDCVSLTKVTIGNGVKTIDNYAFSDCISLLSVKIPDSVTKINDGAFYNCKSISTLTFGNSVEQIGNSAFYGCESIKEVVIPNSTLLIGSSAFKNCTKIKTFILGNNVTTIFNNAFENCYKLENIVLPNSTTSIGEYAFTNCTSLQRAVFRGRTDHINNGVFEGCYNLTVVAFPRNVNTIAYNAFYGCDKLQEVWYEGTAAEARNINIAYGNDDIKNANWLYGAFNTIDHVYDDDYDEICNICGLKRDFSSWDIEVTATGIYSITPSISLSGYSTNLITIYDANQNEIKYNPAKQGWPLFANKTYTLVLKKAYSNTSNLRWYLTKVSSNIFPDTADNAWYSDAVEYAVSAGIMSGYSNGKFGTSDSIQRQDFLVMLARLDGADLDDYKGYSLFPDVARNSYYESAVNWGAENGIVTGYQNGEFGVGDKVTREQLVTFLYRYAKYKGYDSGYSSNRENVVASQYKDYSRVSSFAKDPILWAIEKGVISGKTTTTIVPQGNAQRCEVAKIMYNIYLNDIFK